MYYHMVAYRIRKVECGFKCRVLGSKLISIYPILLRYALCALPYAIGPAENETYWDPPRIECKLVNGNSVRSVHRIFKGNRDLQDTVFVFCIDRFGIHRATKGCCGDIIKIVSRPYLHLPYSTVGVK